MIHIISYNMNYHNELLNNEWNYITPNINSPQKIIKFDDGNEKYNSYPNEWVIFGEWGGKIAIYNKIQPTIIIKSISRWKVY